MKCYKKEANDQLEIGQIYYTKRFALTVDRALCKGCELCKVVCPREAVTLTPMPDAPDGRARAPRVDIDEHKCDFHGICAVICPFSAIKITVNGDEALPAVAKDVFPVLTRDLAIDGNRCAPGCTACADKCPLDVIAIEPAQAEPAQPAVVEIALDRCASCQICWMACPTDAVSVTKFIEGSILIDPARCPDGCRRCLDVCPVDALALDESGKVHALDQICIYCGACKEVCPVQEALTITRSAIKHTDVESGAWNKGLERLTSPAGLARELASKRGFKARTAIENLKGAR